MVSGRTIVGTGGRPVTRWWRALTVMLVLLLGLATAGGASATPAGARAANPSTDPRQPRRPPGAGRRSR